MTCMNINFTSGGDKQQATREQQNRTHEATGDNGVQRSSAWSQSGAQLAAVEPKPQRSGKSSALARSAAMAALICAVARGLELTRLLSACRHASLQLGSLEASSRISTQPTHCITDPLHPARKYCSTGCPGPDGSPGASSAARLAALPVHRLDINTTGCLILARTAEAAAALQDQFASRAVSKEYFCIVHGAAGDGEVHRIFAKPFLIFKLQCPFDVDT